MKRDLEKLLLECEIQVTTKLRVKQVKPNDTSVDRAFQLQDRFAQIVLVYFASEDYATMSDKFKDELTKDVREIDKILRENIKEKIRQSA